MVGGSDPTTPNPRRERRPTAGRLDTDALRFFQWVGMQEKSLKLPKVGINHFRLQEIKVETL